MADDSKKDPRKLTAYERWELPHLENTQTVVKPAGIAVLSKNETTMTEEDVDQSSLVYEPLTASQLEEIRAAAYDEGFSQGLEDGRVEGLEQGKTQGYEQGLAEGCEQGKEDGYQAGYKEAQEFARTQLEQVEQQLREVVAWFQSPIRDTKTEIECLLFDTVKRLTENIVQQQLLAQPTESLKQQIEKVLSLTEEFEGRVRIKVHPDDLQQLVDMGVAKRFDAMFEADLVLEKGGFVIDSKGFFVDGSIESRRQTIFAELTALQQQSILDNDFHDDA